MPRRRSLASILLACALAGCVRAPTPLDVNALVREYGAVQARGELEVRVLDDPRDVQARLALAKLADEQKRPSQAIEQLEAVLRLGGPIGTRWHDDDRARMARLLATRGRVRLVRGAATAFDDLQRARGFGAKVEDDELKRASAAIAITQLRHVDAKERAKGQRTLAVLSGAAFAEPTWLGAKPQPVPRDRGLFGIWLWERGARRAAWETLADWRAATPVKGGPIHDAYLRAYAWWHPLDAPPPATADLVGPERCRFAIAACDPVATLGGSASERAALMSAPLPTTERPGAGSASSATRSPPSPTSAEANAPLVMRTTDPVAAAAWLALTLPQALRGEIAWGTAIAARVDIDAIELAAVPPYARAAFALLTGRAAAGPGDGALAELRAPERRVVAAGRVLDGASAAHVGAALGDQATSFEGVELLAMVAPANRPTPRLVFETAAAAFVDARGEVLATLEPVIEAYRKDPTISDRLARDLVAQADDAAVALGALGALYEALADPARARTAWEAAAALSPEPTLVRGFARAAARAGDPDAAMIHGTAAAAAAGDPATVWIELARALDGVRQHVHALEAARSAIDLAGPDTLPAALDVAASASLALGRTEQAAALRARRARLAAVAIVAAKGSSDPTDAASALAEARSSSSVSAIARLWVASRWNPRDVEIRSALLEAIAANDPRRGVLVGELIALAGDPDPEIGRAAVAALR